MMSRRNYRRPTRIVRQTWHIGFIVPITKASRIRCSVKRGMWPNVYRLYSIIVPVNKKLNWRMQLKKWARRKNVFMRMRKTMISISFQRMMQMMKIMSINVKCCVTEHKWNYLNLLCKLNIFCC